MHKSIFLTAVAALVVFGAGCQQLKSRDQLNKGVSAFKSAQFPVAVEHFKTAVGYEPDFKVARLYLAMAYMQQWIPGADSPENNKMASEAYNQFQKALELDPKDTVAIASIASIYLNQKKWDEAQQWYEKLTAIAPKNADAYYSLGFIAWSRWYTAYAAAEHTLGMKDPGIIKDKKVKEELQQKYGAIIEAGLQNLDKTLQIDPQYDDAMAYENLLIRERADLLDSKEEYDKQINIANAWMDKVMATKKAKQEQKDKKASQGGITQDK